MLGEQLLSYTCIMYLIIEAMLYLAILNGIIKAEEE